METIIGQLQKIQRINKMKGYLYPICPTDRGMSIQVPYDELEVIGTGYRYRIDHLEIERTNIMRNEILEQKIYAPKLFKRLKEKEETEYHLEENKGVQILYKGDKKASTAYSPKPTERISFQGKGKEMLRCYIEDIQKIRRAMERLNEEMVFKMPIGEYMNHVHIEPSEEGGLVYVLNTKITSRLQYETLYVSEPISIPKQVIRLLLLDTHPKKGDTVIINEYEEGYEVKYGEHTVIRYNREHTDYNAQPTDYVAYQNLLKYEPTKNKTEIETLTKHKLKEISRHFGYMYSVNPDESSYRSKKEYMEKILKFFTQNEEIKIMYQTKNPQILYFESEGKAIRQTIVE